MGEKATKTKASINKDKIENDALYDGFYCTATNLFKKQCSVCLLYTSDAADD